VPLITDARAGTVSSGMLGVMGNKVLILLINYVFFLFVMPNVLRSMLYMTLRV
jgi:hypothetical protein